MSLLIAHDADIEAVDLLGHTPIHYANSNGHVEVVKFLIEHGAILYKN